MGDEQWQVITGDCLEVMRTLAAGSVDAILTDLPYGTTACSWDSVIPFAPMWAAIKHVLKPRGVFVTTASQPFTSALVMSNVKWFQYQWHWKKERGTGFILSDRRPLMIVEDVCVFSDGQPNYTPQRNKLDKPYRHVLPSTKGRYEGATKLNGSHVNGERVYREYTHDTPSQLIEFSRDGIRQKDTHPTQKPVALYEYLIRTYTNEGELVLDMCAGSGTTGVAAINTGRRVICIEQREDYADIARARIAKAAEQAQQLALPDMEQ